MSGRGGEGGRRRRGRGGGSCAEDVSEGVVEENGARDGVPWERDVIYFFGG